MQSITVHSPCKINLSLDIVRRLPNGYHEMDMVMQTVDLCDTLTVSLHSGSDIQMTCTGPDSKPLPLACDDSNIAVRCTRAFFEHCGFSALPCSVVIHLVKRIPMMAGLGGGSADGAAVLARMQELLGKRREKQPLEWPSAGSTFKRPQGAFAGKLIEDCGLRGFTVGGAQISEKHCGFVINRGGATCADVVALTEQVRQIVEARTGFVLEREIRVVK